MKGVCGMWAGGLPICIANRRSGQNPSLWAQQNMGTANKTNPWSQLIQKGGKDKTEAGL